MTSLTFLDNKFSPSLLSGLCAERNELMKEFDKSSINNCIYVSAPSGSGKSVSTLLWLTKSNIKHTWFVLNEYDNLMNVFCKQLAMFLLQTQPTNKAVKKILDSPKFTLEPITSLHLLVSELRIEANSYALVFDDMHKLTNKDILTVLPSILQRLPSNYKVVFISKYRFEQELHTMFYIHDLVIDEQKLAFSHNEIQEFYGKKGIPFNDNEINVIHSITKGLAYAVNNLTLAENPQSQNKIALSDIKQLMHYCKRFMTGYYEKYIWENWTQEIQNFCLSVAILDDFDIEIAAHLSDNFRSEELIHILSFQNEVIFLKEDNIYAFKKCFQNFLCDKVTQQGFNRVQIYIKTAYFYEEKGEYYKALLYAFSSGNFQAINYFFQSYFSKRKRGLLPCLNFMQMLFTRELTPSVYKEYPLLHVLALIYYNHIGKNELCLYHTEKLIKHLPQIAKFNPIGLNQALWSIYISNANSLTDKITHYNTGRTLKISHDIDMVLADNDNGMIFVTHYLPFLHRSALDFSELIHNPSLIAKLEETYGKTHWLDWCFWKQCLLASFAYEQNNLEQVQQFCQEAPKLLNNDINQEALFCAHILEFSVYFYRCQGDNAIQKMKELERFVYTEPSFEPNLLAFQTKIKLLQGDLSYANAWLSNPTIHTNRNYVLIKLFSCFTTIRSYIALHNYTEAENVALRTQQSIIGFHRVLDHAEINILLCIIFWNTNRKAEATHLLEQVLRTLRPFKYVRVVADEGKGILPILKRLVKNLSPYDKDMQNYLDIIIVETLNFSRQYKGYIGHLRKQTIIKKIKLSRQQQIILTLLSQGYSNNDICKELGIKITTLKSHTSALYKKLNVNKASLAIQKAKEMNLL